MQYIKYRTGDASMQNICLTLQYDGTRYLGWSRPEKDGQHKTISYKITEILKKLTGEDITLYGGAKTDPGVHAMAQTASFRTGSSVSADDLRRMLNKYLPRDIFIQKAKTMPERFRADLNAASRTYEYRICTARVYNIFTAAYEAHIFPAPDVDAMKQASVFLLGKHNFRPFTPGRKKKGTEREIHAITFRQDEELLTVRFTADDFLYQMPAVLTGTLLEAGLGIRTPESIKKIFTGEEKAGAPLEAKGLLLENIRY